MNAVGEFPIVIAGGGIAGLSLARALRMKDVDSLVLERRASGGDGMALNLPGNAIASLTALGLGDAVRQLGHPLRRREYRTRSDKLLFEIDEVAFWGAGSCPRGVRRTDLLAMLAQGLGSAVRRDVAVGSIAVRPDRVDLALSDGSLTEADLLVGADGVGSGVRRQVFGSAVEPAAARLAQASWRFMAPDPGIGCWTVWAGARGMILLMPVGGGEVYGWAAATRADADGSLDALALLARDFPERVRRTVDLCLASPATILHSPLQEVRISKWQRGRIVLIGDAAHATAPVWAQGAAMALEDAIVLAECLTADPDRSAAVRAYDRRRRPRVEHVQAATEAMSKAARLPATLRALALPLIGPRRYRQIYEPLKAKP